MAYIGISGYIYQHWRGAFYPAQLAQRKWLAYAAERFNSIELNGTFYSLKNPSVFARWVSEVPDGFVFAVKGSRYITHNLKLRHHEQALANFLASGVLALGPHTGPFLWQLPRSYSFDPERIDSFLTSLPRDTATAERLAAQHDERLRRGSLIQAPPHWRGPLRHAMEVRHESYDTPEFYDILRRHDVGFVIADTAGRFLFAEQVTTDFVYVRLHGSQQLYVSRYSDDELESWAARIRNWERDGRTVFVYFDNDGAGHAPYDAMRLAALVNGSPVLGEHPGERFTGRV